MKAISDMSALTLRCCTVGSVDDGKSTLIGRLMLDAKALMTDHLSHVEEASRRRGFARTELALLTDGLRAEREQGITIDVAYRYFATARRRIVLADAPGHVQYTRNMLTGASTSDAVIMLVDARRGTTAQTRRHAALSALLGVPSVLVCVNKMDEVGFDLDRFHALVAEVSAMFQPFASQRRDVKFVPVAALEGDNVVTRSGRTPWYDGPTVLEWLEAPSTGVGASDEPSDPGLVLPVQWVIRPQTETHRDYRGWAGRIERGALEVGRTVVVLPSREEARVVAISHGGERVASAGTGASVTIEIDRDLDISRGDVIVDRDIATPSVANEHDVDLFWLASEPARVGGRYVVKHLATRAPARLGAVADVLDVTTLERNAADTLRLNDIGRVSIKTARPLVWAPYEQHRGLGSIAVFDEATGETVAAGLLRRAS